MTKVFSRAVEGLKRLFFPVSGPMRPKEKRIDQASTQLRKDPHLSHLPNFSQPDTNLPALTLIDPQESGQANLFERMSAIAFLPIMLACLYALLLLTAPAAAQTPLRALPGHIPQAIAASRLLRQAPRETRLNLSIGLPLRNSGALDTLIAQISDPYSPNFHKFVTPEQFADSFGPTEQDYQALIQFAQQNGLTVTGTHSNRAVLSVSAAVAEVEKAFNVKMNVYSHPTRGEFYAADREPTVPSGINTLDISGLDNFAPPQPMSLTTHAISATPLVTGSGPGGYFIGKDFRAAYAPGVALTGAGQTVGLLEFDGFFAGDVTKNFAAAGLPAVATQTVLVDGVSGSAGGANIEVILDIMMASYMAPGLSKVIVYEGANPNDVLNRMATDNLAQQLSSSWGFSGVNATTEQIFKQYIAQGQSILQASGDSGSYSNGVMSPSDDPSVTVVGGTSLVTSGSGGAWLSESTWSGSGGGVSTTYPIPSWQQTVAMASKGGSTSMRNIPDVALTADIQMYLICNNGQQISVGGTSAAAPLWAGFIALANQQAAASAKPRVGFLNPLLYSIGNSGNFASDLHDITAGSNGGFRALAGYDLTTGWGSPAGQHLINDLTGVSTAPSFTLATSSATATLHVSATETTSVTITQKNSFSGTVSLSVSGLPAGVTAAFSPAQATTASSLTLTATSAAVAGTYPLTITGVSGSLSATTPLTLSVVTPSFTLTPAAAILTTIRPNAAATLITVTGQNGFSATVAFTAASLPTGVTATFLASPSGSTVNFAVSATALPGAYPITIKGVSGALSATTSITLNITVPAFTLTSSPATLTVARPGSVSSLIVVGAQNGFSGTVTFAAASLPSGVTATFVPASTGSTVTFAASASALAGAYPLTIKGVSGSLSATTSITLNVTVPSFTLSFLPTPLALLRGSTASGTASVTPVNGFSSAVTLTASGLPSGVTASFGAFSSAASGTRTSLVTFTSTSAPLAGNYPITLTGTSAPGAISAISETASFTLTILAPSAGTLPVNLASSYNVNAFVADNLPFTGAGIDGGLNGSSTAYSANLIGLQQTIAGTAFFFGPANALDSVSGKVVPLPAGQFTSLKLLATGVNGAQPQQVFKVTYTDGTVSTIVQGMSDWFTPGVNAGETKAMTMAYRDNGAGQRDNRTFYLYEYTLPLTSTKVVASITLPNNRNVVVLAATLASATATVK